MVPPPLVPLPPLLCLCGVVHQVLLLLIVRRHLFFKSLAIEAEERHGGWVLHRSARFVAHIHQSTANTGNASRRTNSFLQRPYVPMAYMCASKLAGQLHCGGSRRETDVSAAPRTYCRVIRNSIAAPPPSARHSPGRSPYP